MSPRARGWLRMVAVAALVVALDQASKAAVIETMAPGERTDLALGFDLTRVTNTGIAFGLFSGGDEAVLIVFTLVALGLLGTWFTLDTERPLLWLGVGLLAGGALGNLADRLREGAVTDFFDPPLWPAFNLADVAITLGVVVIVLTALRAAPQADPA